MGGFSRLFIYKARRPDNCDSPRLQLHKDGTGQLVCAEGPPNPITRQRLPFDRCSQHCHLLLELGLVKPSQAELESIIFLIGGNLQNTWRTRIDHRVFKVRNMT